MINGYKRKKELESLYENNPNELCKIFLKAGFPSESIPKLFKCPKSYIIGEAQNFMCYEKYDNNITSFYTIPEKYKKAEYPSLQQDRDNIYNEMNNSIDKTIGEILQSLYDYGGDDYVIGIHKTGAFSYDQGFSKGIPTRDVPDSINDHVAITKNLPLMLAGIKYCESYKFSRGAFILKIPRNSIEGNINTAEPLYYKDEKGQIYIRPEYIAAYVPVLNGKLCDIYMNDYPRDNLYTEETEFYYDGGLETNKSYGFINIILISIIIIIITLVMFIILK